MARSRSVEDFIVDFSKEESGGGGGAQHFRPGFYKVKIINAKTGISENKQTPYLELSMAFMEGNYRKAKKKISERLYISPKAMRRFRILLQALDIAVPRKFDATKMAGKLKGKVLVIELQDEERSEEEVEKGYSARSRVTFEGFYPEDFEPDEDEAAEDEDDEDLEDEADEDEDEDEAAEDEDDEDDEDEDEEEEPEPKPRKRAATKSPAKSKAPAKSRSRKAKKEDEDEDLDDLDLDNL